MKSPHLIAFPPRRQNKKKVFGESGNERRGDRKAVNRMVERFFSLVN
ncbi:hypothetical protein [Nostoc sp. FACHB-892]|nr:hypothetical protein [Nostoc sp. FACHB-892]